MRKIQVMFPRRHCLVPRMVNDPSWSRIRAVGAKPPLPTQGSLSVPNPDRIGLALSTTVLQR